MPDSIVHILIEPIFFLFIIVALFALLSCLFIYKSKSYLFKNVSYDFTHWGVVRHGERTDFSKPWRDITKFKETKAFFVLYTGKSDFHIVQKRMLKDLDSLNDFRKLLQQNISQ